MVDAVVFAQVLADTDLLATGAALLLGGLVFLAILMFFSGMRRSMSGGATGIEQRLRDFGQREAPLEARRPRGRQGGALYASIDRAVAGRGATVRLAADLARADLKVTVGEFYVARIVFVSLGALMGFALPVGGHILLAVVLALAGYFAPRIYVSTRKNRRLRAFNTQLADTIGLLSSALRSGYSMLQAMELVAREGPQPMAGEFERVVREVGLGLSPEEALANLVRRVQSDDLELLVTAINVQREVGGNLAEVLDTIASTIRDRVKLKGEIRVLTAQQQYSGYIVGLIPVVLSLILFVINPNYMLGVFHKTVWCGWTMLTCSVVMISTGFFFIQRIVRIRV
ncbi:MAG TPA: type II secretion system F family protein [Ktedonobacterales bacterium]|nr:type II secretion system F family protein [Ktedonobacterales bacterium]